MIATTMRNQLVAVIAVLGCAGGCATTGGKVSAVFAAVTATSTVLVATQSTGCERGSGEFGRCLQDAAMMVGLGLLTGVALFTSLVFEVYGAPDKPASPGLVQADGTPVWPPGAAPVVPLAARDPRAAQLTREANLAARVGHCYLVGALGAKVRGIDPDYYEQVFASDRAIASCL